MVLHGSGAWVTSVVGVWQCALQNNSAQSICCYVFSLLNDVIQCLLCFCSNNGGAIWSIYIYMYNFGAGRWGDVGMAYDRPNWAIKHIWKFTHPRHAVNGPIIASTAARQLSCMKDCISIFVHSLSQLLLARGDPLCECTKRGVYDMRKAHYAQIPSQNMEQHVAVKTEPSFPVVGPFARVVPGPLIAVKVGGGSMVS